MPFCVALRFSEGMVEILLVSSIAFPYFISRYLRLPGGFRQPELARTVVIISMAVIIFMPWYKLKMHFLVNIHHVTQTITAVNERPVCRKRQPEALSLKTLFVICDYSLICLKQLNDAVQRKVKSSHRISFTLNFVLVVLPAMTGCMPDPFLIGEHYRHVWQT